MCGGGNDQEDLLASHERILHTCAQGHCAQDPGPRSGPQSLCSGPTTKIWGAGPMACAPGNFRNPSTCLYLAGPQVGALGLLGTRHEFPLVSSYLVVHKTCFDMIVWVTDFVCYGPQPIGLTSALGCLPAGAVGGRRRERAACAGRQSASKTRPVGIEL